MTATKYVKQEILSELKKGNMEVLKGLPPVMAMSLGMALQNEVGQQIKEQEEKERQSKESANTDNDNPTE